MLGTRVFRHARVSGVASTCPALPVAGARARVWLSLITRPSLTVIARAVPCPPLGAATVVLV